MVDDSASPVGEDLTLQPVSMGSRPRRRALWGVLAVAVIAAGALVVSSGSGGPPRLPVALGSSAGREAAAGAQSADMALAWVTYVAGDGLPSLGGKATAYRLSGVIDAARVQALAAALGMSGEPTRSEKAWHLESGTAVLDVSEGGGGTWWYNADQRVQSISSGGGSAGCDPDATECAVAGDDGSATTYPVTTVPGDTCASDGTTCTTMAPECPPNADCVAPSEPCGPAVDCIAPPPTQPVPPVDLPTKDDARKIALDLVAATGMDVDGANVTIDGPYDAWYVTVEPLLDGVPVSGLGASVGVGSKGAVTNASGTLGTPERLGDYPLLDTRAAIDRLNKLQEGGYGVPVPLGAPDGVARDLETRTSEAPAPGCAADDATCVGEPSGPATTAVSQCKTQPDGSEICESTGSTVVEPGECVTVATDASGATEPGSAGCVAPPVTCIISEPPVDATAETTETTIAPDPCIEPAPYPEPMPEPEPIEVTLTDAIHVLTLLYSSDGAGDVYLVPGYRFSGPDGTQVEVAAVDDDSLAPTTTAPDTTDSSAVTPPTDGCEIAVEGDASGTTHTIQTCPEPSPEPSTLEPGQRPEVGVGYYVDATVMTGHCSWITAEVGGRWWWAQLSNEELAGWSTPTEGGTFTLVDPDHAEFVGDAQRTKVAKLVQFGDGTEPPYCA